MVKNCDRGLENAGAEGNIFKPEVTVLHRIPRVFVPLDQWSDHESSGSNHFEITKEIT